MDVEMLRELIAHQQWADNRVLNAIRDHAGAADDGDIRKKLHHIALVQRSFLALITHTHFDLQEEMRAPDSFEVQERRFHEAHEKGLAFIAAADDAALAPSVNVPWFPGLRISVGQALTQMVMHTQHHRGQCSMRLRELGAKPPITDYIVWLDERQPKGATGN
jgi:uncharacterized damage-inducible protein DinB